jgi:hypothetical protein
MHAQTFLPALASGHNVHQHARTCQHVAADQAIAGGCVGTGGDAPRGVGHHAPAGTSIKGSLGEHRVSAYKSIDVC